MAEIPGGGTQVPDVLTPEQIARYAYQAGFRGQDLITAVAVALAESRGKRTALNPNGRDYSVGLWQINMLAHGDRFGTEQMLYDPAVNAKAAFALYTGRGNGFQDWSVFIKDGTPGYENGYSQFLREAQVAAQRVEGSPASPSSGDIPLPVNSSAPLPGSVAGGVNAGGGGFFTGSTADTDMDGTVDEGELAAHIQRTYPQMLWALDDPELGPLLRQAAEEGWDQARIYGGLIQTNFWRNHPDRERVLVNLKANDPATYARMVEEQTAAVMAIAEQIGWGFMPDQRLRALVEESMRAGWSPQQIQDNIVEAVPITMEAIESGMVGGRIVDIKTNLDAISNDFLLSISDREKTEWIRKILNGSVDEQSYTEYLNGVARGQFPWLNDAMDRGVTPKQFLTPYQNWIAQTMEMSPEQIDMRKGRYQRVVYDDQAGSIRTLPEVEEYIKRTFKGWHSTRQANESYAGLTETLGKMFGKVA